MTDVRKLCAIATAVLLSAPALGACGGDDEPSGSQSTPAPTATQAATETPTEAPASGGGAQLEIDAVESGGLAFDPAKLTAAAGTVTIVMDNTSGNSLPHAVELEGNGVEEVGETVPGGGGTSTVTADLRPGEYVYYCPVGNHREQGMEGTLTVE